MEWNEIQPLTNAAIDEISEKNGSISSTTSGAVLVVAALSK